MRPVLVCAAVFVACALGSAFGPGTPTNAAAAPAPAHPKPYGVTGSHDFKNKPATSCAAASCHGAGAVGAVGSEHSTWAPEAELKPDGDPHNKAYRVLFNDVSVKMAKALKIGEAHKADLCLKCHAVPTKTGDDAVDAQILAEGVGCSACHGSAEKWVGDHYSSQWKAKTNRQKAETGFVPTNNLVARLLNCAQCHVGDADRDVNHALYAAGHPRITFEAAKMHNTKGYRKHWEEKTPQPDFEVRVWVVGQAATLRAAAELLRVRAERAEDANFKAGDAFPDRGAWPEYSGYSCYACHQSLSDTDARKALSATPRPPGTPGWEVWSGTAVKVAHRHCNEAFPGLTPPSIGEVEELQKLMRSRKGYSAKDVALQAAKAVRELDAWLIALQDAEDRGLKPMANGAAFKLAEALANNALGTGDAKDLLADHDWDALASSYLGVAAMAHASGGANKVKWGGPLEKIRDGLRFDPDPNKRVRFDSPWMFDLAADAPTKGEKLEPKRIEQLRQRFIELRGATALTGGN